MQRDVRAVLEFLKVNSAIRDLEAFPTHVLSALPKLIPSSVISYSVVEPRRLRIMWVGEPPVRVFPDVGPVLKHRIYFIAHYPRNSDGQAAEIFELVARNPRLTLYREFHRLLGMKRRLAITLPAPPPRLIGIVLGRAEQDFSTRDRRLLRLVRPHLIQAYQNAEAATRMKQELAHVTRAVEALDRGVIMLARNGRVRLMTVRAQQWLEEYFGNPSWLVNYLPKTLHYWVRRQEALRGSNGRASLPREPLVIERQGKRLVIRLLGDPDQRVLLLEEQTALDPSALEPLGLTRREAEVLRWVALGKTNSDVSRLLVLSPRTVQKHLERVYRKLGVETRTAAAARVHQVVRRRSDGSS